MIESHAHVRITLRRFDHGGVERGATDRIDAFVRIDIVWRQMQFARPVVNHATAHWYGVLQDFFSEAKLLERVNAARGKREVYRATADDIAFARISASLV